MYLIKAPHVHNPRGDQYECECTCMHAWSIAFIAWAAPCLASLYPRRPPLSVVLARYTGCTGHEWRLCAVSYGCHILMRQRSKQNK